MANKIWYCSECNCYPDTILEVESEHTAHRKWNGSEYELEEVEGCTECYYECGNCGTMLEELDSDEFNPIGG